MTTIRIYKSDLADARIVVRWGRKHGMPRGRGRKGHRILVRERLADAPARVAA